MIVGGLCWFWTTGGVGPDGGDVSFGEGTSYSCGGRRGGQFVSMSRNTSFTRGPS